MFESFYGLERTPVGSGKSTTIRALHQSLDPARYRLLYLSRSEPAFCVHHPLRNQLPLKRGPS